MLPPDGVPLVLPEDILLDGLLSFGVDEPLSEDTGIDSEPSVPLLPLDAPSEESVLSVPSIFEESVPSKLDESVLSVPSIFEDTSPSVPELVSSSDEVCELVVVSLSGFVGVVGL